MNIRSLLIFLLCCCLFTNLKAQNIPVNPSEAGTGVFLGATRPLRDIPALSTEEFQFLKAKAEAKLLNKKLRVRSYPYAYSAFPKIADAAWQSTMGKSALDLPPETIFEGQSTSSYPPDCNGAAGPNHYMQTVNTTYAIYDKTGTKLVGPTLLRQLFSGVAGATCDDGDPIVLYDDQADRWVVSEFSLCDSTDRMLIAISTTNDPTGTWNAYSFDVADMPDYPKISVWQDGYYMGDNNSTGNDIYVFERDKMLAGDSNPKFIGFKNAWRPGSVDEFMCVPPVDNDGAFAPAGSPGLFIAMSDDAFNGGTDQLWIYELSVNWASTSASTFNRVQQINVTPFDSNFGNDWTNIKQLGTDQELDAIPQVIMNVPQYRNFGTYQTIVCCHSVDVDKTDHAGIRWYELRKTPPSTTWTVRQQGTYAPDEHSRWMGSIMLNGKNELGLGYSISSSTINPGIRYCGQTETEYTNASGLLDFSEKSIYDGNISQTATERWGDYAQMAVDPENDATFWFSTEYVGSGSRKTKIAAFQIGPIAPIGDFTANDTLPCINTATVSFTSQVRGNPTQYAWTISPRNFTYTGGTDSTSVNPKVIFNAFDNYSVSLTLTNFTGTTTTAKPDFIKVNSVNADFTASSNLVVTGNAVTLNDASSCGANTWLWDFGAGASPATANTQGPHAVSYSSDGLKTISLTVNGISIKLKTGYINVIGSNINMTSATVATCNGTFYDPGGPSVNYSNSKDYSMIFKPGNAGNRLQFVFTSFNVEESATGCTKDYLKIYDGDNVNSPLIGTFCGTVLPGPITTTNEAGAILFVFHSNSTISKPGWSATIGCIPNDTLNPSSLKAIATGSSEIDVSWVKNAVNSDVLLAWSSNGKFGTPVSQKSYAVGDLIPGGGVILSQGGETVFNHTGLNPSTSYFYKAFSKDALLNYSSGITANTTTLMITDMADTKNRLKGIDIYPNPATGLFRIVSDKLKYPKMQVIITNVNGVSIISRECKGESEYFFDLGKSPQGTYLVKIKTDKELLVKKLVIIK